METVNSPSASRAESPPEQLVIGLMSGTSLDGIDVALTRTNGHEIQRVAPPRTFPYSTGTRERLTDAVARGAALDESPELVRDLNQRVAGEHAEAVRTFRAQHPALDVQLVGFHGQTVWHAPERGETLQLGDPQGLANDLNLPVVGQLRAADMAAGGEGAPLAPVYHAAVLQQAGLHGSVAWLNLGGVANLTLIDGAITAGFDCGPGNALLDRLTLRALNEPWDQGGARALRGAVHDELRDALLCDKYFKRPPPKSLDRDHFLPLNVLRDIEALSLDDALATLAAVTVESVLRGLALSPRPVESLVVSGGGVHNRAIMNGLEASCHVLTSDDIGVPADGVEAELVALLAARQRAGLPSSFPETTGARHPVVAGNYYAPETVQ